MTTGVQIIGVLSDDPLMAEVRAAHRGAKSTLGPLPDAGFDDRADRGTLLAAMDDGEMLGYLLYDLPANHVKIVHLCVVPAARRRGVGRRLVAELRIRHEQREGVQLSCRRDFTAAAAAWTALGFHPYGERTGRKRTGSVLTLYGQRFGGLNLFSFSEPSRARAAMDHNVFIDVEIGPADRPEGRGSMTLLEDWLTEHVELCITAETLHEADRTDDPDLRRRLLQAAGGFRILSEDRAPPDALTAVMRCAAPRAGAADHRHLAHAAQADAEFFVTRDQKLLDAADAVAHASGPVVLRPEDLVLLLDERRRSGHYEPVALEGTGLEIGLLTAGAQQAFSRDLIRHGAGERLKDVTGLVRSAVAHPDDDYEAVAVRDLAGSLLAGTVRRWTPEGLEVDLLRVRARGRLGDALARQLAGRQRVDAARRRTGRVVVRDPHLSPAVERALRAESFERRDGRWSITVRCGFDGRSDAPVDLRAAADVERREWPVKVLGAGLPTWLLPIRPAYAESLFDAALASTTLFPRPTELGLNREQVYYRSPRASAGLSAPGRVLWYVSQQPPRQPTAEIRAVSRVVEVVTGPADVLYRRFARLGTWSFDQVRSAADPAGRVMAVRFADTEVFERPLSRAQVTDLYAANGERFAVPYGPRRVSEHMFCLLDAQGSAYAP